MATSWFILGHRWSGEMTLAANQCATHSRQPCEDGHLLKQASQRSWGQVQSCTERNEGESDGFGFFF